ncbi:hypothetical protein, partial [Treponema endosymbiont of Eucomonympha sp.]|uniref:hypothetical protein n=1 Tax=Treponema endosymbiont of Eucomonympha sp. TaxID=1580831 RepID=UPI001EE71E94
QRNPSNLSKAVLFPTTTNSNTFVKKSPIHYQTLLVVSKFILSLCYITQHYRVKVIYCIKTTCTAAFYFRYRHKTPVLHEDAYGVPPQGCGLLPSGRRTSAGGHIGFLYA